MPFRSKAQRAWMYANHPKMAKRWADHTPKRELPDRVEALALAASQGPVQLALAEAAENSTAMVVLPGDPPGRNVCAFIRQFVQERTKLIVVAQTKDLPAGSFERMLRASMPDVEKKLRVMDAGASLADALNSAERNRHYRPGQALEVYCDPQQARNFAQEITDGSLKFDPTVIHIVPTKIPLDSSQDIQRAVQSGDESAMHRVLDAHIFSDQDGLADYRQAIGESIVREFLTDIAPNKKAALGVLGNIINQNATLLAERGIDVSGLKYLGAGNNGAAWQLGDGRVLKVTTDDAEAHVAAHIKGKRFKHIFTIHDAWAFPGQHNGHHVYGLVTEGGLKKPGPRERKHFDWMVNVLERHATIAGVNLEEDFRKVLETMMRSGKITPEEKAITLKLVKHFDLPGMMAEMKKLGVLADLHSGNFMQRPDGTFVIIDIGTGGSQESAKPPFLEGGNIFDIEVPTLGNGRLNEFGTGSPGSGANGPAQMRGSNSSSWASGQLALKDPRNHVPEDPNADEQDSALDWGPGRVSGASF